MNIIITHSHHHHSHHSGEGVFGGILNGAACHSNLKGGNGSSEAADVLSGIGGIANWVGVGRELLINKILLKKQRKTKALHGKGF